MSFHVPEDARLRDGPLGSTRTAGNNGAFTLPSRVSPDRTLYIIASDGLLWEHVSVSVSGKRGRVATPVWDEMCQVKDVFWDPEDVVMQLHPAKSAYVNCHPHTLHLWRPMQGQIPTPPAILVGPLAERTQSWPHHANDPSNASSRRPSLHSG